MNWFQEISGNSTLQDKLSTFLINYGTAGLEQALQLYTDMQREYLCKTKTSATRIKIDDIYYIAIHGHNITVHTRQGIYQKYGTLTNELETLSKHGFIKCDQSCIVSLIKIKEIRNNQIILTNNESLHISRNCAPKLILAFHSFVRK